MRYLAVTMACSASRFRRPSPRTVSRSMSIPAPGAESAGDGTGGFAEGDLRAIVGAQTTAVIAS